MITGKKPGKQEVELYSPDGKRKYTIESFVDRGGSSSVFKAFYQDERNQSHHGILKEFFPKRLEENNNGINEEKTFDDKEIENTIKKIVGSDPFIKEAGQYVKPYETLLKLIEEEPSGEAQAKEALRTFIPNFSLLWSEEGQQGVPYIWTDLMPMVTYEQIAEKLCGDESVGIEESLLVLVSSLAEVTECVGILHDNRIIHEDIKGENFGFVKRNEKVLKTGVLLFDINSLHSSDQPPVYINEEIKEYEEDIPEKRDIIGLGLALAHGLNLNEDEIKRIARISNLNEAISEEDLLKQGIFSVKESPKDKRIITCLVHIFEKSIRYGHSNRYDSCEEMAINLRELEKLLMPEGLKKEYTNGLALEIIDRQERRKNKMRTVFQNLLYHRPLFVTENRESKVFTVAIMGFGTDSQQFLDVCLETAQSMNYIFDFIVYVFPGEQGFVKSYLSDRPELENYFCINGEDKKKTYRSEDNYTFDYDAYGYISFVYPQYESEAINIKNLADNTNIGVANYVFISTNNENNNKRIAEGWSCIKTKSPVMITYVSDDDFISSDCGSNQIVSVNPLDTLEKDDNGFNTILRMAFNTHLVWDNNLNVDFSVKKKEFEDEYNRTSSISSVLAIQYRLHNYGIDVLSDPYDAAKRFEEREWTDEEKRTMAWQEHKRWVTEKICAGWEQMSVEESCACGRTSDKSGERPKHVCLLPSDQNSKIRGSMWERDSLEHLGQLDPLDRMSVMLHREYNSLSTRLKEGIIIDEMSDRLLETWFSEDSEDSSIYYEWRECVYRLIQGERNQAMLLKSFDLRLDRAIERIKNRNFALGQPLESIINQIRRGKIDIILESLKYVDYKGIDVDLIEKIPFILTYTDEITLVVTAKREDLICSMEASNPTNIFAYVSAATILHPKKMIIAYVSDKSISDKQKNNIKTKKNNLENYLKGHGVSLHSDSNGITLLEKNTVSELMAELRLLCCDDEWLITHDVANILADNSYIQEKQGIIKKVDYCCAIETDDAAFWLKYIPRDVSLYISDIWNLLGRSIQNEYTHVSFTDDMMNDLCEIYSTNRTGWKKLCEELKRTDSRYISLGRLSKRLSGEMITGRYLMPASCYQGAQKLLKEIKDKALIEQTESPVIIRVSNDSCVVVVKHDKNLKLGKLFADSDKLMLFEKNCEVSSNKVEFFVETLKTNEIKKPRRNWGAIQEVLICLKKKGFIDFRLENNSFSVLYGSNDVKKMLEDGGRFLEMYTYNKLLKSRRFSDVSINSKITVNGSTNLANEVDCFITKGFQTVIVECKAQESYKILEYREELCNKLKKYGVNGMGILVVDSGQSEENVYFPNNITLITSPDKIRNLDKEIDIITNDRICEQIGKYNKKMELEDLRRGMVMEGEVKSISEDEACVDIGVGQEGYLHKSNMERNVKSLQDVFKIEEKVLVEIKNVTKPDNRIELLLKNN